MDSLLAFGRQALAAQPFSQLVGAELTAFGADGAELRVVITHGLLQQHGFVHGGVLAYLADNALTFAGGGALGSAVVTSEFKINYLRPAKGDGLVARARVLSAGKTQAVCRCDIFAVDGDEEKLCAAAQGTISKMGGADG
jgi:uncharacterized protein (TIGR00369 family)